MPSVPDAILLCGGAGLRLRSVIGNAPKGMAEVLGRPFLELLLRQLRRQGFELFDIQFLTEHTARMGGVEIPRREYLRRLRKALASSATFVD